MQNCFKVIFFIIDQVCTEQNLQHYFLYNQVNTPIRNKRKRYARDTFEVILFYWCTLLQAFIRHATEGLSEEKCSFSFWPNFNARELKKKHHWFEYD